MEQKDVKAGPLLSKIHSPEDLRKLEPSRLQDVCDELRDYIIETVSVYGEGAGW
jgi:1-deoxy-D-xylulose-5-phosphate synthase